MLEGPVGLGLIVGQRFLEPLGLAPFILGSLVEGTKRVLNALHGADRIVGTMQSIEHTLRSFDRMAENEQERVGRLQKSLTDFQSQAGRPFEHELRLTELVARQSELNAALDLDKGERQVAPPADGEAEGGNNQTAATRQRVPRASRNGARDVSYRARRQRYAGDGPEEEDDAETENVRNREERPSRACERTVIQKV